MPPDATSFGLLTMKQVAEALNCSRAHACNLAGGKVRGCAPLPAVRMGSKNAGAPGNFNALE